MPRVDFAKLYDCKITAADLLNDWVCADRVLVRE
jgi:hypothetical protein